MVARYLIFSFFFSIVLCFNQTHGKTIHGKAKIIDGDTIHIGNNKIRLHAIDAPEINQKCKIITKDDYIDAFTITSYYLTKIDDSRIKKFIFRKQLIEKIKSKKSSLT